MIGIVVILIIVIGGLYMYMQKQRSGNSTFKSKADDAAFGEGLTAGAAIVDTEVSSENPSTAINAEQPDKE